MSFGNVIKKYALYMIIQANKPKNNARNIWMKPSSIFIVAFMISGMAIPAIITPAIVVISGCKLFFPITFKKFFSFFVLLYCVFMKKINPPSVEFCLCLSVVLI